MTDNTAFLSVAPAVSAGVALITFLFSVGTAFLNERRESNRRDWERLQEVAQILHRGGQTGLWAQKLAAQELAGLKTKRSQALLLAREALTYWETKGDADNGLLSELRTVINELSK